MRRLHFAGTVVPALALVFSAACAEQTDEPTPAVERAALNDDAAPRGYLVALSDAAVPRAFAHAEGLAPDFVYEHALKGFSVTLPPRAAAALAHRPGVLSVTEDVVAHLEGQQVPTGITRIGGPAAVASPIAVPGVAIIDTGIGAVADLNVVERVACTKGTKTAPATCAAGGVDDNNHGTHVAGTVGAIDNGLGAIGVYPGAPLYAVKVCDSRGACDVSKIVAGIDWATARASAIRVINISIGWSGTAEATSCAGATSAIYRAICGAQAAGITVVVAAGNETDDAKNHLPAAFAEVITVSALSDNDGTRTGDVFASFSNYGPGVDIMAPGVGILSTLPDGTFAAYSGTSMATPHVSGAAARILAAHPEYGPAQVRTALLAAADPLPCPSANGLCAGDPDGIVEPLLWIGAPIIRCTQNADCATGACNASGVCVQPACSSDADCADADPCTDNFCVDPGLATAACDSAFKLCSASLADTCCGPQCSGNPSASLYDLDCPTASAWMHVSDIWFVAKGKAGWQVFVKIVDANGQAVVGATVTGNTTGTGLGGGAIPFTQVTDATGTVKALDLVSSSVQTLRTEVTAVSHPTFAYDAASNAQTCATLNTATKIEGVCN